MNEEKYRRVVDCILENQDCYYRLAYSFCGSRDAAMDVVQSAICRGLEYYDSLKKPDAVKSWMYRIVLNEAARYLKKYQREIPYEAAEMPAQEYREPAFDRDDSIYQAVCALPDHLKTIIILHYYEDQTIKQVAEITNTNVNTVKTRLYTAQKKLKTMIPQEVFS